MTDMSRSGRPHWGRRPAMTTPGLDREGIETVARFIADGWAVSECALVVTTSAHQRRIDGALRRWGHDPDELRRRSRYTCVDADTLIAQVMVAGELDAELFGRLAGDLLVRASAGGRRVRAFGEVVARLWQRDQVAAALEVERQVFASVELGVQVADPAHVEEGRATGG
ncbi:MAG: MEDS domain-containing protein [Humibacillus sp.]